MLSGREFWNPTDPTTAKTMAAPICEPTTNTTSFLQTYSSAFRRAKSDLDAPPIAALALAGPQAPDDDATNETQWCQLQSTFCSNAQDGLGRTRRQHQDCFDDSEAKSAADSPRRTCIDRLKEANRSSLSTTPTITVTTPRR
nr:unnamed protein product [Spirometra erinaceieuropaei]